MLILKYKFWLTLIISEEEKNSIFHVCALECLSTKRHTFMFAVQNKYMSPLHFLPKVKVNLNLSHF